MTITARSAGRANDGLREWKITTPALDYPEGSALIESGRTKVLCAATVEEKVPAFLRDKLQGWVTAEYSMLPRSTHTRSGRERNGKVGGRTLEIQRLIGRSLRSVVDLRKLYGFTITVDCDVIQADGGTRTASITGAWVAMAAACDGLLKAGMIAALPHLDSVAAVSVGIVGQELLLDLDYGEDHDAEVDMNVVMTGSGKLVEVQATAEGQPFTTAQLMDLLSLAGRGIERIREIQTHALRG